MNVVASIRYYINKMTDESGSGMKILLMDQETKSIVSVAFSQSEIASKEVYLFDVLENPNRDYMKHMKCLCFLRPTKENISNLIKELKNPKYGQYYLYFTNVIEKMDLKTLAEIDEQEVVREVQEYFADYVAVNTHVFSMNIPQCGENFKWNDAALKRTSQGLISVLLSLKKSPVIRHQNSSEMCRKLAESVRSIISRDSNLFDFRHTDIAPVLLILDRREDPITPLLNQWTYQAMVHEIFRMKSNIVNLKDVPGISKELEEIILSAEYDEFYENNMYSNYGEICVKIKELMEDFQKKSQSSSKVETIADMKAFVENYPQFKKMSGHVSKHVTLVGELSRLVSNHNIMEVSEVEQQLACQEDHSEIVQKIRSLTKDARVKTSDIVRVVTLYALRYEQSSNTSELKAFKEMLLKRGSLTTQEIDFMNKICQYGGSKFRETDLFLNQNPMAITKRLLKGLKGVDNIYTQHTPLVKDLVEQLIKGKLREASYPFLGINSNNFKERPQEIIVFMIGGITFEETAAIQSINKAYAGNIKIIIGGTNVHNFKSFQEEVLALVSPNSTINENNRESRNSNSNSNQIKNSLASAMREKAF